MHIARDNSTLLDLQATTWNITTYRQHVIGAIVTAQYCTVQDTTVQTELELSTVLLYGHCKITAE